MKYLTIILLIVLVSCQTTKDLKVNDKSKLETYTEKVKIQRPGTITTLEIPKIKYVDTTITTVNYQDKTVLRVHYDEDGRKTTECQTADIYEEVERKFEKKLVDVVSAFHKDNEFKPQTFLYALALMGFVFLILFIVILVVINNIKKTLPSLVLNTIKQLNN